MNSWQQSVFHAGSEAYVQPQQVTLGQTVMLRIRMASNAPVHNVYARICPDGEQTFVPLQRMQTAQQQWWEGPITVAMPQTGYRFWLLTDDGGWWYSQAGLQRSTPLDANDFRLLADYAAPEWVPTSVFYQIFPDRFADGDPSNNVYTDEYTCYGREVVARAWGEQPRSHVESGAVEFFGGDLQGIVQRLDYLEELGVSALYLNPVFAAPTNHKYDTADYFNVDPHLGGDEALIKLRQALTKRSMRLVLDIVLNHCGATNLWFTQAQANRRAATAEYFTWYDHPESYEAWWGIPSLPKLNYASSALRRAIYAGNDAVIRYWLREPYLIDGWRLDVANMMGRQGAHQFGHKIGRGLRRAIKQENPHAYMLGEHFYDGTPHLQGNELDASMNYRGFGFPVLQWLAGFDINGAWKHPWADQQRLPTEALVQQWHTFLGALPWQIALQQFNVLTSHDTPRLLTIMDNNPDLLRVAVTLQMTWPGVPCVYYGDEIGLTGGGDPYCRGCMPWEPAAWDQDLRSWYQKIILTRRESPALAYGSLQFVWVGQDGLAYVREHSQESMLVVALREPVESLTLPVEHSLLSAGMRLHNIWTAETVEVQDGTITLQPQQQASVWQIRHEQTSA